MTELEKVKEIKEYIKRDFKIAKSQIGDKDPVEYFVDRALDPLDVMNVVYCKLLNRIGYEAVAGNYVKKPEK